MFDIRLIREDPDSVRENLARRNDPEKLKLLEQVQFDDRKYREDLQELEKLKHDRNVVSEEISKIKKAGGDVSAKVKEASEIPKRIKALDDEVADLKQRIDSALMRIPNMLHESVPVGKDDSDNVVVKTWGTAPKFDFEPKNHAEILLNLGLLDEERAAKVAGRGFYYLKGPLAMLNEALRKYAIDFLTSKGYILVYPPAMLKRDAYQGMVDLADFENVMYKIQDDDLYMIATAEHPMGAMYMNEVLLKENLPIKFVGLSTNFRREIGAHGKYTKGLFRVHQFDKIEQFIFCNAEESWKFHEELQRNSEQLYEGLGMHYQVVNVCTGDIGPIAAKKYDINCWMADGSFRETGSNSNCTDYQARRINIKFREKEGQAPAGYIHTLNNTALAMSRTMVCLIEQNQNADGTVNIPKALWPYMNGLKKLEALK
jgi:seryl-tRNA synthetase